MPSVGKICLYCSKPIGAADRVAACDRCYAAHHEECWNRNGRCSTFRCAGQPRTMLGSDLPTVLQVAMERANEQPVVCPFCASKVFAGVVRSKPVKPTRIGRPGEAMSTGLLFVGKGKPNPHGDWFGKNFLAKMLGNRSWFLPGAHVRARSCGKCRKLFLFGIPVDDAYVQRCLSGAEPRYCPHCATQLWQGHILVSARAQGGARFECDEPPDFHHDWFGHNVLDRFFFSRWTPAISALPAHSCPDCQYTEVAGRPVYRQM